MTIVSNASPLISLSSIGLLDLLAKLYGTIIIPQAVYEEVVIVGQGRPGSQEVAAARWIVTRSVSDPQVVATLRAATGLDAGESEAIILASELNASVIILDDEDARQYAQTQRLPVIGAIGVLLLAKQRGSIAAVKPLLDNLIAAGIRIGAAIYNEALRRAAEK